MTPKATLPTSSGSSDPAAETDACSYYPEVMPILDGTSEPTPTVFIVGAGVVGTSLAARLVRSGVPVVGMHGRQSEQSRAASAASGVLATSGELPAVIASCDVIIIAVRDSRIAEMAERLIAEQRARKTQVVLQVAGSWAAEEVLAPLRPHVAAIGTLHPLVSVTEAGIATALEGAAFGLEGDEPAVRKARTLVRLMGGRPLELDAAAMALYHAGAVIASNYLVVLADIARTLLVTAGVAEDDALPALVPLLASVVRNLGELGLPSALTGPVARGDATSVERNLEALADRAPQFLDLYQRLGREALRLARARTPSVDDASARRIAGLFGL